MQKKGIQAQGIAMVGATVLMALLAAGSASAAAPGFYIAGQIGKSTSERDAWTAVRMGQIMGNAWADSQAILAWSGASWTRPTRVSRSRSDTSFPRTWR